MKPVHLEKIGLWSCRWTVPIFFGWTVIMGHIQLMLQADPVVQLICISTYLLFVTCVQYHPISMALYISYTWPAIINSFFLLSIVLIFTSCFKFQSVLSTCILRNCCSVYTPIVCVQAFLFGNYILCTKGNQSSWICANTALLWYAPFFI